MKNFAIQIFPFKIKIDVDSISQLRADFFDINRKLNENFLVAICGKNLEFLD